MSQFCGNTCQENIIMCLLQMINTGQNFQIAQSPEWRSREKEVGKQVKQKENGNLKIHNTILSAERHKC